MSYDGIIEWIEKSNNMGDFNGYDDLKKFNDKFNDLKKRLPGSPKQVESMQSRMDEWQNKGLIPENKPSYSEVVETISINKYESIKEHAINKLKEDLKALEEEGYSRPTIDKVEQLIKDKEEQIKEDARSLDEADLQEAFNREQTAELRVINDAIDELKRSSTTEDIDRAMEDLPSASEVQKQFGKSIATLFREERANAAERKYDLLTDEQKRALLEGRTNG